MAPSVIKIENLFKEYRLGNIGYGTLREDLESWWARINGKLDPNSIIGYEISQNVDLNCILALNNINLEVKEGERLGIIGKNGAGKTTLLKILSRISSPTKGSVKIKGRVASLIAVGTGFHGELTGRENIYLNGSILGLTKFEIDQCFDEIVDFSGVEQFIDTPVKRYSSGMNLRLGFAVAAHLDPDILIVDEVLAVGDAEFRKKALGKMKDVSDSEKRTILFVSHNMGAIKTLCEKCILLDGGRIVLSGNAPEVVDHYVLESSPGKKASSTSRIEMELDNNKNFQLVSAELVDGNGQTKTLFECDEDILINLICYSRKPIKGLYGVFSVKDGNEETNAIASVSYECEENVFDSLQEGLYKFSSWIPSRILKVGHYSFTIYFESTKRTGDKKVDYPNKTLDFQVIDSNTPWGENRTAMTSTILKWTKKSVM